MENGSRLKNVASACFAGEAISILIDAYLHGFYLWSTPLIIGYALIAISIFASLPVLISVGAGVSSVGAIMLSNLTYRYTEIDGYPKHFFYVNVLFLVFFIILIVTGVNKKIARQLGFVASGVAVLRLVVLIIGNNMVDCTFGIWTFLDNVLIIVGAFMFGMAFNYITTNTTTSSSGSVIIADIVMKEVSERWRHGQNTIRKYVSQY